MLKQDREWLFVLVNSQQAGNTWWLKITGLPELMDYLETTNTRWAHVFDNWLHDSEFQPNVSGHGKHIQQTSLTQLVHYRAVHTGQPILSAISDVAGELAESMMNCLYATGVLYVNANGGWNGGGPTVKETGSFCRRKKLVWPDFTEDQVRVSKFPGGTHWYAYIGNVQVRDGDKLKFNTKAEALAQAKTYITT